jgi:hypothetical protein
LVPTQNAHSTWDQSADESPHSKEALELSTRSLQDMLWPRTPE